MSVQFNFAAWNFRLPFSLKLRKKLFFISAIDLTPCAPFHNLFLRYFLKWKLLTTMQLSRQRISLIDSNWTFFFSFNSWSEITSIDLLRSENKLKWPLIYWHLKCTSRKWSIEITKNPFPYYSSTCKLKCVKNVNVTECQDPAQ